MKNKNIFYRGELLLVGVLAFFSLFLLSCRDEESSHDIDVEIRLTAPDGVEPLDVSDVYVVLENVRTRRLDSALSVACQPLTFHVESGNYNIQVHGKKNEGKLLALYSGAALRVAFSQNERFTVSLDKSYVPNPDWVEGSILTTIQVVLPAELASLSPAGIVVNLKETVTQRVVSAVTNAQGIAEFTVVEGNYVADCSGELVKGREDTRYYGHMEQIVVGTENSVYRLVLQALGGTGEGEEPYQLFLKLPEEYTTYSLQDEKIYLQKMGVATTYELTCDAQGKASIASLPYGFYALQGQVSAYASDGIRMYVCQIPYTEIRHAKETGTEPPLVPTIEVKPSYPASALVFKEIYFTKSRSAATGQMYNADGYVELYNNSSRPIYIDGVSVSETYQNTAVKNGIFFPEYLNTDNVVPGFIFTFPGSGREHRLDPGKSVIVAENALNHHAINPGSPVDLSTADFEIVENDWRDTDTPEVPNMINYFSYTKTITSFHNRGYKAWFITKADKPMPEFLAEHITDAIFPNGSPTKIYVYSSRYVLDGVIVAKPSGPLCRPLPAHIDVGYTYCTKANIAKTIRRKVARKEGDRYILQDTNNSSVDFIPDSQPSPRVVVE